MTTIAYAKGVLAGEQRLTTGGFIWHDKCRKVFKLPDGSLFGASGDNEGGEILLRSLRQGIATPELPEDAEVNALLITTDGTLCLWESSMWIVWAEPFAAIGSGKEVALAALRLGHSAVQAVKAGIASDVYSGGKVQSVKLKGTK